MKKNYFHMLSEDLNKMSSWQKYIIDLILIAIFIYAVYSIFSESTSALQIAIKLLILITAAIVMIYLFEKHHKK